MRRRGNDLLAIDQQRPSFFCMQNDELVHDSAWHVGELVFRLLAEKRLILEAKTTEIHSRYEPMTIALITSYLIYRFSGVRA